MVQRDAITRRDFLAGASAAGVLAAVGPAGKARAASTPEQRVVAYPGAVNSLDPIVDFSNPAISMQAHLFEGLVDYEGPDLKLVPKLATSWSTAGTAWTFQLRSGVKWHDRTAFTAEDVRYSFDVAKSDPASTKKGFVDSIDRVEVLDPLTLRITTKEVNAALLSSLAYLYIVPRHVRENLGRDTFGKQPIGTGPYKLASWRIREEVVLERNDEYWGGPPEPKRIVQRAIPEAATRLAELKTGGVNIVCGLPVQFVPVVRADANLQIYEAPGVRGVYYPIQTKKGPLRDKRVRQALNFAVDREAIVQQILEGYGVVRTGVMAKGRPGFNANAMPQYQFDPERAKALLAEAGARNVEFTWDVTKGFAVKDTEITEFVRNQLGKVGVKVNLNLLDIGKLAQRRAAGDFDMTFWFWALQSDPDVMLTGIGLQSWGVYYSNPRFDELLPKGRLTTVLEQREAVYREIYQVLVDDPPFLYTHAQSELYGVRKGVDWRPFPFAGNAGFTYYHKR